MSGKMYLRIACGLLITGAFLLTSVSPVQAQAPSNDNFANATIISTTPFSEQLDTSSATIENGEPFPSCSQGFFTPGHTVWYAYTPSASGRVLNLIYGEFPFFLAVYTGTGLAGLAEVGCWYNSWYDWLRASFDVQAGQTYYLQFGSMGDYGGLLYFELNYYPPPPNDNFADAIEIDFGTIYSELNFAATTESGEPSPSCSSPNRTVWFRYTPDTTGFVTAESYSYSIFAAAYTGSNLGDLSEVGCASRGYPLPLRVEAGKTYYYQFGSWGSDIGLIDLHLYETPPPMVEFGWGPEDPSVYDNVEFCDNSYDPVYNMFSDYWWDFGDGVSTAGDCVYHQFAADGDYTVWHNAQTNDGRTDPDGITKTVMVRTHNVSITRVAAPKSASAGQTRQITVYIKNNRYPERVEVQLFRSNPEGFEMVGVTNQNIPVRSGNRTTPVNFSYTFTQADAEMGKVTFKAVVNLLEGARDALPADNEAISPPTKVQ